MGIDSIIRSKPVLWKASVSVLMFLRRSTVDAALFIMKGLGWMCEAVGRGARLRVLFDHWCDDFYLRRDRSQALAGILKDKVVHLDVGASGGLMPVARKYAGFLDVILCEPDAEESAALRAKGFVTIDRPLYREPRKVPFFETKMLEGSSIYKPLGPYMDFYNSDPAYLDLYRTVKTHEFDCSTIAIELKRLGIPALDFLKIDTQGAELDIVKGLGDYRPLIIFAELQYLPMYEGCPTAFQVCDHLYGLGYIPAFLTSHPTRANCTVWGDGLFMPSWVDPRGVNMILAREEKYIALMMMFGQIEVLKFVAEKLQLKNRDFIKRQRI